MVIFTSLGMTYRHNDIGDVSPREERRGKTPVGTPSPTIVQRDARLASCDVVAYPRTERSQFE
jgi:hypothetical protein